MVAGNRDARAAIGATGVDVATAARFLRRLGGVLARAAHEREQILDAADDSLPQEAHQQHEHQAEHQLPGRAQLQGGLQEVLQEEPHAGADERAEQRATSADGGLHDQLARGVEHEGVRAA